MLNLNLKVNFQEYKNDLNKLWIRYLNLIRTSKNSFSDLMPRIIKDYSDKMPK